MAPLLTTALIVLREATPLSLKKHHFYKNWSGGSYDRDYSSLKAILIDQYSVFSFEVEITLLKLSELKRYQMSKFQSLLLRFIY